ncbi:MAG: Coq4 family protein [Pseudomonadota bacterium]
MSDAITSKPPIVDRAFAEKFLVSVDRPLDYGVYFLFHDWWAEAPGDAIEAYMEELHAIPGATEFLKERYIAEPLTVEGLKDYAPGTLGAAYRDFVVENDLIENFGRDYRAFQAQLHDSGKLKRMPEDMSYMMVRGTQLHDFMHVLTGYGATIPGELALASYYLSQIRFPYHAIRLAVTMAHAALVAPKGVVPSMDAFVDGWYYGRNSKNLNFEKWEERLGEPLEALQAEMGLRQIAKAA